METKSQSFDIARINQKVGQRVKERRVSLGLSRSDVAKKVGVSQQQFEKYEKGMNRISAGMLVAIALHLKIDPGYFFQDIDAADSPTANQRMALEVSRNFLNINNPKHRKLVMMTTRILSDGTA